jgi:DHA1 family tetracycline resistance protein-like MFS transporter
MSEDPEQPPRVDLMRFFLTFCKTKGAIPALVISTLLSFGIGSTVGVVPDVLSDRYSRLYYGYDGPHCSNFDRLHKPDACQQGADQAQASSAWASLLLSLLTLVCNPVVGSVSDVRGRRGMIIASVSLTTLSPLVLVWMQWFDTVDPIFYYIANSLVGMVNYISIIFAAMSDTIPDEYRAASYAIILAGFYAGFALAPSFALLMSHFQVSILSLVFMLGALVCAVTLFPETLPEDVAERNRVVQCLEHDEEETNTGQWIINAMTRPVREISILNRDTVIRLVSMGSFFSSMVFATDSNLLLFYIEDQLDVRDKDIAQMFFVMGILGIVFQAFLLQPLTQCLGEKGLLVTSFLSGTLHNLLYGLARDKRCIYVALAFSQLTKTNYPILSSLASKDASADEQGRVQGALFALNALGAAIGPLSMQAIYDKTKNTLGPGTMFFFASFLYATGTAFVSCIPSKKEVIAVAEEEEENIGTETDLEEPLLGT